MRLTIVLMIAILMPAQEILRPVDQSHVKPGALTVVVKGSSSARLTLDGADVALKQVGPGAHSAEVRIGEGPHALVLRDGAIEQKVQITGGSGSPQFRAHPPAATCETCHAVKEGIWAFRNAVLAETCFGCHDSNRFPVAHSHAPEIIPDCQMCHNPHGSAAEKHLKMKKDLACKQCHG